jgi:SagB-type dehydrogenase family enzyme
MKKSFVLFASLILVISSFAALLAAGEVQNPIVLMKPQLDGGKPLMQALKERKSSREFSSAKLPLQVLSNLLWAGFGVNRPDSNHRTAPSARNWQEIDIYVAMADGLYLYDAKEHRLQPILPEDIRSLTGQQAFVRDAPVNLVYVADHSRMTGGAAEDKEMYSAADTGFISENVYLFCASEGLATVVRGSIDRQSLAKAMRLRPDQKIMLSQTVGYPKKQE